MYFMIYQGKLSIYNKPFLVNEIPIIYKYNLQVNKYKYKYKDKYLKTQDIVTEIGSNPIIEYCGELDESNDPKITKIYIYRL